MTVANLKRYDLQGCDFGCRASMEEDESGEWVKFEDVKKFLKTSTNNKSTQGCVICGCNISLKGYCAGCQTRVDW